MISSFVSTNEDCESYKAVNFAPAVIIDTDWLLKIDPVATAARQKIASFKVIMYLIIE